MIRAWTPKVPLKVKLQHCQILHLLQKSDTLPSPNFILWLVLSVTFSFCDMFWWVLVLVIRKFSPPSFLFFRTAATVQFLLQVLVFFVGKNPTSLWQKLIPRGSPPWCLLSGLVKGLVKTSDFQPWGHTNVTGFSELRDPKKKAGIRLCPKKPLKRDPWRLKYIYIISYIIYIYICQNICHQMHLINGGGVIMIPPTL